MRKSDRKNIRRFIEGLYFDDTERITATLKELFGVPRNDDAQGNTKGYCSRYQRPCC